MTKPEQAGLREKLAWVKHCQCERCGDHDQNKTGCPSCDFAHADYPLFTNAEVLQLIEATCLEVISLPKAQQHQALSKLLGRGEEG